MVNSMIVSVICPNCGAVLEWDTDEEPLERCEKCGYELSFEDEYGERAWKKSVVVAENEVFRSA